MEFSNPEIRIYGTDGKPADLGAIIRFNTAKGTMQISLQESGKIKETKEVKFAEPMVKIYGKDGKPADLGAIIRFNTARER